MRRCEGRKMRKERESEEGGGEEQNDDGGGEGGIIIRKKKEEAAKKKENVKDIFQQQSLFPSPDLNLDAKNFYGQPHPSLPFLPYYQTFINVSFTPAA